MLAIASPLPRYHRASPSTSLDKKIIFYLFDVLYSTTTKINCQTNSEEKIFGKLIVLYKGQREAGVVRIDGYFTTVKGTVPFTVVK